MWVVVYVDKMMVSNLMCIGWCIVGWIIECVVDEVRVSIDGFVELKWIGIDEIVFCKCYKYLVVVVDYDIG